jgi:hypothetical protein
MIDFKGCILYSRTGGLAAQGKATNGSKRRANAKNPENMGKTQQRGIHELTCGNTALINGNEAAPGKPWLTETGGGWSPFSGLKVMRAGYFGSTFL